MKVFIAYLQGMVIFVKVIWNYYYSVLCVYALCKCDTMPVC